MSAKMSANLRSRWVIYVRSRSRSSLIFWAPLALALRQNERALWAPLNWAPLTKALDTKVFIIKWQLITLLRTESFKVSQTKIEFIVRDSKCQLSGLWSFFWDLKRAIDICVMLLLPLEFQPPLKGHFSSFSQKSSWLLKSWKKVTGVTFVSRHCKS